MSNCLICGKINGLTKEGETRITCSVKCRNTFISRKFGNSPKTRMKKRQAKLGNKNPNWLGDNVGYGSLHIWIKTNYPRLKKCEKCNKISRLDLANISGKYRRNRSDWEYLCRRCHMLKDGRLTKWIERIKKLKGTKLSPQTIKKISDSHKKRHLLNNKHKNETL